jgi:S1-C subfamily serine protease
MKQVALCLSSALLGGVIAAVAVQSWSNAPQAAAADRENAPAKAAAPADVQLAQAPGFGQPAFPARQLPPGFAPEAAAPPPVRDPRPRPEDEGLTIEERLAVNVYETVNKSVVNINTKLVKANAFFLFDASGEGAGSGSVLDKAGHILTNYHVVEGAREVQVTTHDGKTHDAHFVGADPVNDVAVIKIDVPPDELVPVVLGDSARMRVGMRVFAIGNPFGLERTLTTGIVSSLNRSLRIRENRTIKSIIQIDAAINPGSSGGPLLDNRGTLVGMNTAIASSTGQNSGVGFAIPSNLIARIVGELIQHGKVIRPEIGIRHVYPTSKGLLIASLTPGGPAEAAGMRGPVVVKRRRGAFTYESLDRSAADLIVAVDNVPIKSADDFLGQIEAKVPGDEVVVTVLREGKQQSFTIRLGQAE